MSTSNTPPSYGEPAGPGIVALHWKMLLSLGASVMAPRVSRARSEIWCERAFGDVTALRSGGRREGVEGRVVGGRVEGGKVAGDEFAPAAKAGAHLFAYTLGGHLLSARSRGGQLTELPPVPGARRRAIGDDDVER